MKKEPIIVNEMCIRDSTTSLATSVNKQCMVLLSDKVRLATEQDFDDFHKMCIRDSI